MKTWGRTVSRRRRRRRPENENDAQRLPLQKPYVYILTHTLQVDTSMHAAHTRRKWVEKDEAEA